MNRKTTISGVSATLAIFVATSGLWRSAAAESFDIEIVRAPSKRIDSVLHELTHVLQQAMESSGAAKSAGETRSPRISTGGPGSTAENLQTLADRLLTQSLEMQKIYSDRRLEEGIGYMNTISAEARMIKDLTQHLGPSSGSSETSEYYRRVSERLRHVNRAKDDHDKWIELVSASSPSGSGKARAEIHPDEYGRVKTRLPQKNEGENSGAGGDPDQPLVQGRVHNAPEPDNAEDRPTESISLNYSKIRLHSVSVHKIYEYGDRLFLLDEAGNAYSLPDGIYSDMKGGRIQLKGKKILQNYTETQRPSSEMGTGTRTYEPIQVGESNRGPRTRASGHRRIYPVQFTLKSAEGRYTGQGTWFELKNQTIANIGGVLYKHESLPFVPMDTPRSKSKGNAQTEFKVEEGK